MKKLLLTLIVSLACCGSIFAQYESHWPDFYYPAYDSQTALVAAIELDGAIVTAEHTGWDALEIAFFVGDQCRGAGVAFGRNLFQAENPGKITKAISEVVHNDLEVEEALKFLK